jgi:hypothetical protein
MNRPFLDKTIHPTRFIRESCGILTRKSWKYFFTRSGDCETGRPAQLCPAHAAILFQWMRLTSEAITAMKLSTSKLSVAAIACVPSANACTSLCYSYKESSKVNTKSAAVHSR